MRNRAFSLIELLVVISIITLLISIMLPSLGKSRLAAREGMCGSNMRQAAIAFTAYTGDNGQLWPDFSYDPASKSQWTQANYWTQKYWRGHMLKSYSLQRELLYSPTNDHWNRDDFYWYDTGNPASNSALVMGYFYFGSSVVNTAGYRGSLTVAVPSNMTNIFPRRNGGVSHYSILWADLNRQLNTHIGTWLTPGDARRWGSNHWYGTPDMKPHGSHSAFTDNHVEWVPGDQLRLQSTYTGSHFYW
jgi:prepilin-type N-terminal cleavage/methylation domain-containing protein